MNRRQYLATIGLVCTLAGCPAAEDAPTKTTGVADQRRGPHSKAGHGIAGGGYHPD